MSTDPVAIEGEARPQFEPMRDALAALAEPGCALAVEIDGEPVVDLWTTDGWQRDTIVHLFSGSKPMPALCVLRLVDQGRLELDQRVTSVWPEYGAAGKDQTTVRHLLAHQAGVVAFADPQPVEVLLDWDRCIAQIEAEPPEWPPGARHGEHALLYGHLLGELVRRIDGRGVRDYFREEIAAPLGIDIHVGVSGETAARAAQVTDPGGRWRAQLDGVGELMRRGLENPPGLMHTQVLNGPAWREAEIPAVNVHASARALARLYTALAGGGELNGKRIISSDLLDEALRVQVDGQDAFFGMNVAYGLGFRLDGGPFALAEFGYGGIGGTVAFANRSRGVAFAFVTASLGGFDRAMALERALAELLDHPSGA
jgi:CubicO group peptidase (beta-lactamase class C family)